MPRKLLVHEKCDCIAGASAGRLAILLGTGGTRAVLAESILLKQQLLVLQRSRRRAPNLRLADRLLLGFVPSSSALVG